MDGPGLRRGPAAGDAGFAHGDPGAGPERRRAARCGDGLNQTIAATVSMTASIDRPPRSGRLGARMPERAIQPGTRLAGSIAGSTDMTLIKNTIASTLLAAVLGTTMAAGAFATDSMMSKPMSKHAMMAD